MSKEWTEGEIGKLKRLRQLGASVARASVALKRGKAAVRLKAKELGIPFPYLSAIRREMQAKETALATGLGCQESRCDPWRNIETSAG